MYKENELVSGNELIELLERVIILEENSFNMSGWEVPESEEERKKLEDCYSMQFSFMYEEDYYTIEQECRIVGEHIFFGTFVKINLTRWMYCEWEIGAILEDFKRAAGRDQEHPSNAHKNAQEN